MKSKTTETLHESNNCPNCGTEMIKEGKESTCPYCKISIEK